MIDKHDLDEGEFVSVRYVGPAVGLLVGLAIVNPRDGAVYRCFYQLHLDRVNDGSEPIEVIWGVVRFLQRTAERECAWATQRS